MHLAKYIVASIIGQCLNTQLQASLTQNAVLCIQVSHPSLAQLQRLKFINKQSCFIFIDFLIICWLHVFGILVR